MTKILVNLIVVTGFLCVSCKTAFQNDIALFTRKAKLQHFSSGIDPVFYITSNLDTAVTVSTDEVWRGGSASLDLDGSDRAVEERDGESIYAKQPDFTRRLTQVDGVTPVSNNSTHIADTLIGSGKLPKILYVIPRRV